MTHKVLIVTTVSGFLWQFEKNTVEILKSRMRRSIMRQTLRIRLTFLTRDILRIRES